MRDRWLGGEHAHAVICGHHPCITEVEMKFTANLSTKRESDVSKNSAEE